MCLLGGRLLRAIAFGFRHTFGTLFWLFLVLPWLQSSTPRLSYMTVPDLVLCVPSPFGKPLFVLKQLFAFSFSGSFLSARTPPTPARGGGGGCWDWLGYAWGLGWTAWWMAMAGCVAPTSLGWAGSGGFRRPCRRVPLTPPPPAHGNDIEVEIFMLRIA